MKRKKEQIKNLGMAAISLSASIGIPSIILLLSMLIGIGKQFQYGYSMYIAMLIFLGVIPLLLSIILGIITYIKYRKNRHILPTTIKKIALLALLLPLLSAILVFLDIILDTFVF